MSIDVSKIGQLKKACSGDVRPTLAEPYLRITETITGRGKSRKVERAGVLHASDSYIAVSINVPVDDDETEGIVPLAALAFAKTLQNLTADVRLIGDRAVVFASGREQASFPRGNISGKYPDMATIIPNGEVAVVFGLNPRLLMDAAYALGVADTQGLRIEIREPMKPLCVSVLGDPDKTAIVMPIRLSA